MAIKQALEVLNIDFAIFVGINDLKCFSNVRLIYERLSVETCTNKLLKINYTIAVHVTRLDDLGPLLWRQFVPELGLELLNVECTSLRLV